MIGAADDARIYCESNERTGAFALRGWGQQEIGDDALDNLTTAFTIAVRSAQIVPPVPCHNLNTQVTPNTSGETYHKMRSLHLLP
jgi:hypothetical protein